MFFMFLLLKRYVHDPNHVINWDVIQVEPKGEFQIETFLYPRQEGHNAPKSIHRESEGEMGALRS